jgi:hypothetical protein
MPPVRSQVVTPVTEHTVGVVVVTSNKCPSDLNPEFWPLANKVDATNRPLLLALKVTALAEYKAPVRDVDME